MNKKSYPEEYHKKLEFIGALIREYRVNRGYSQMELSEYLNLHRNTLSRAERGGNLNLLNLIEIAQTLAINLSELFWDVD